MSKSTPNRVDDRGREAGQQERASVRVGIYARVSSDQQAQQQTIQSQVTALRERVVADGHSLSESLCFLDDGVSGATLMRPALEQLRDTAYASGIAKLYVHSPDRLARKYAWQVLLVDELQSHGVELVFLNHTMGASPEGDLLLQMQGMFAEYERAKILERSRRGKRHAAQRGSVNVLSGAPFGYRYITKHEGQGTAAYEVIEDQAAVVKQVFEWVGCDRLSIGEVSRRLEAKGVRTATGKTWWDRATVWGILKNTAYMGTAAFGKTRTGERRQRPTPQRGHSKTPRRTGSTYDTAKEDWTLIPVTAIVDEALFETVQEQLDANRQQASERKRGARYLLQGLVKCSCCGYAYYGKKVSRSSAKGKVPYAYYRCVGTDGYRFGGQRVCDNKQVRTDKLDEAVWDDVCELLRNPHLLKEEYERRLAASDEPSTHDRSLAKQVEQSQRTVNRLIDAYSDGVINREEFDPRIERARQQLSQRQDALVKSQAADAERDALQESLQCLEAFAKQIEGNLDNADWNTRREIIRTAIDHIEVEPAQIRITYRINFPLFLNRRKTDRVLHFRWRRAFTASRLSAAMCCRREARSTKTGRESPQPPKPDNSLPTAESSADSCARRGPATGCPVTPAVRPETAGARPGASAECREVARGRYEAATGHRETPTARLGRATVRPGPSSGRVRRASGQPGTAAAWPIAPSVRVEAPSVWPRDARVCHT